MNRGCPEVWPRRLEKASKTTQKLNNRLSEADYAATSSRNQLRVGKARPENGFCRKLLKAQTERQVSGFDVVQPAAAGIDQSHDLICVGVDNPVVATIGTTSGLGLRIGPVFDPGTALFSPPVGVERLDDVHADWR
jgi:hypothetical protein